MSLRFLLSSCLCTFCLVSCGDKAKENESTTEEIVKPAHPWDWQPEDAELMLGRRIYLSECAMCHDEGEEGSPALTRKTEWETREAKGIEVLIGHAINGFTGDDGKMPARGGADTLTDGEVAAAVKYMVGTPK